MFFFRKNKVKIFFIKKKFEIMNLGKENETIEFKKR